MAVIIILDLWEEDKSKKKIAQFNSFDEMPVASNNDIIKILDKKYKILSIRRTSKSDFTNHHKTVDDEIYEIIVEKV